MKTVLLGLLFVGGALLAATANLQLSIGAALMVVGYNELRKSGVTLDQLDDVVMAKVKELLAKKE